MKQITNKSEIFMNLEENTPNGGAVRDLTATVIGQHIKLEWKDSTVSVYDIERAIDGGPFQSMSSERKFRSMSFPNLTPGTSYTFRVRRSDASPEMGYAMVTAKTSGTAPETLPITPISVTAYSSEPNSIHLTWRYRGYGEDWFEIQRESEEGQIIIATVGSKNLNFDDVDRPSDMVCSYRVRAVNKNGVSEWSESTSSVHPVDSDDYDIGMAASKVYTGHDTTLLEGCLAITRDKEKADILHNAITSGSRFGVLRTIVPRSVAMALSLLTQNSALQREETAKREKEAALREKDHAIEREKVAQSEIERLKAHIEEIKAATT